jgi:hypothetical protein
MAIKRNVTLTIKDSKTKIDNKIHIYQNDKGIELHITLKSFYFQINPSFIPTARIIKPNGEEFTIDTLEVLNGNVIMLLITEDMTDELSEIGKYRIQIHLYDPNNNRITIPHFEFYVHPLIEPDIEDNTYAIANRSMTNQKRAAGYTNQGDELLTEGQYTRIYWNVGDWVTSERLNNIEFGVSDLYAKMDELMYKPVTFSSFNVNPSTAEIGSTVATLSLSWGYSKNIEWQKLDGSEIDKAIRSATYNNITTNRSWSIQASDGKTSISRNAGISFLNGKYTGVSSEGNYDSSFILKLSKTLTNSRSGSFTVNCSQGQYIFFAIPVRFGTPKFTVGGFEGGFSLISTIDFTNSSNYTEPYYLYKSENHSLGNTTVNVG